MNNKQKNSVEEKRFIDKISFLDSRERRSPDQILNYLEHQELGDTLDIGSGSGFLTLPAANRTSGVIYALDADERMLNIIKSKSKMAYLDNIMTIHALADKIPFERQSVDTVLASLILHEVPLLEIAIKEIGRVLKEGGQLLCLEYEKDESVVKGPPMQIRIHSMELQKILEESHFKVTKRIEFNESIYILVAVKVVTV